MTTTDSGVRRIANMIRLSDAGYRERSFAEKHVLPLMPKGITLEDLMEHAGYDFCRDEVCVTIKSVFRSFKVVTP